jgi:hypothetical protein
MMDTPIYEILKLWVSILSLGGPSLLFLWGCLWIAKHIDVDVEIREIDEDEGANRER